LSSRTSRLNVYVTDVEAYREAAPTLGACLAPSGVQQAATLLGVAWLARPELLIEIEATAAR
jgi:enamine deaminase RidA (YjgF/YER057c/UK114 family)